MVDLTGYSVRVKTLVVPGIALKKWNQLVLRRPINLKFKKVLPIQAQRCCSKPKYERTGHLHLEDLAI
jgi:hypothetical protein